MSLGVVITSESVVFGDDPECCIAMYIRSQATALKVEKATDVPFL